MSWIDDPVLVHVGLPKTATSWLQEYYFPQPWSGFWIPPVPSKAKHPIKQIGHWIVTDEDGRLIDPADFDCRKLRAKLSDIKAPAGYVPVVSNERLAGHPLSNGFDRRFLAERIKQVFPKAKILLTIREQNSVIMSNYMQYLKYGGWHSPEKFLKPYSDARLPTLTLQFWNYDRLFNFYCEIFDEKNVLILPQELLRADPVGFLGAIAAFSGVAVPSAFNHRAEANPRKPHSSSYLLRRLTFLSRKSSANAFTPPLFGESADRLIDKAAKSVFNLLTPGVMEKRIQNSLTQKIDAVIGDFYRESNRQLAAKVKPDLAALGYKI